MAPKSFADADLEPTWAKLLAVPGLLLKSTVAILLLWSETNNWTNAGPFYQFVVGNRAAVQIVIQILATGFGTVHTYTLCVLTNFWTRLRLVEKPYTLDWLRFWRAICGKNLDWSMAWPFLIPLVIFQLLVLVPAAIWAGALTPVATPATVPSLLRLPRYSQASADYWAHLNWTSPQTSKWIGSVFTYSPNYDLQGLILNDAASATSVGNMTRVHRKLDNTGYSSTGRSYGVASSVGLVDETTNTTAVLGYQYVEAGYLSNVSCIMNATADWAISKAVYTPESSTYPNIYLATGTLANGNAERYAACGLAGPDNIFALVGSASPTANVFSIAAGQAYGTLDKVQCTVRFRPTAFSVAVNATERLIAVTPAAANGRDIDPTGFITDFAMRVPTSIAQHHACDLYHSLVGSTFVQNIQNVRPDFRGPHGADPGASAADVLRGVEDSLTAMLDSTLLALSSAQLMIVNDTFAVPTALAVQAIRIGEAPFINIVAGINFAIVLLYLIELARTRVWSGLGRFDYTDIKSVIVGASGGGTAIAERARTLHAEKQSRWRGDPGDSLVGKIRVRLMREGKDLKLVGVGMAEGSGAGPREYYAGEKRRSNNGTLYKTIPSAKASPGGDFDELMMLEETSHR